MKSGIFISRQRKIAVGGEDPLVSRTAALLYFRAAERPEADSLLLPIAFSVS